MIKKCSHLTTCLGDVVDANDLYAEIVCFINLPNKSELNSAISILRYFIKYQLLDTFPNLFTCTKILTTIPASVAAGEHSFSELKLIKYYLRSKMSQHRLNALAMMSIEREVVIKLILMRQLTRLLFEELENKNLFEVVSR